MWIANFRRDRNHYVNSHLEQQLHISAALRALLGFRAHAKSVFHLHPRLKSVPFLPRVRKNFRVCLNSKAQGGNTSKKTVVTSFPVRHDRSLYPILPGPGLGPGPERWNAAAQKQGLGRKGMPKGREKKRVEMEYFSQLNRCKQLQVTPDLIQNPT